MQITQLPNSILLIAIVLLAVQFLILFVGSGVRYYKYRNIGLYNRIVKWPNSYKIKLLFQIVILLLIFGQLAVIISINNTDPLRYIQIATQVFAWIFSLLMFRFEFKRALPHIWYMHPFFWAYTSFYYSAEMII